jgi:YceI-like domain
MTIIGSFASLQLMDETMNASTISLSLFVSLFATALFAAPLKISSGSVTFLATGKPGFLKINGAGPDLRGTLDKTDKSMTGELTVTMEKFATGIDLRDEHMKEKYFEVKRFPEAILKIKELALNNKGEADGAPFKGTLLFHGVEKDIVGTASVAIKGSKNIIDAEFPMALKDFNIDVPSYAGVKVADSVVVKAKVEGAP